MVKRLARRAGDRSQTWSTTFVLMSAECLIDAAPLVSGHTDHEFPGSRFVLDPDVDPRTSCGTAASTDGPGSENVGTGRRSQRRAE
jgi:hypothetical protein